MYLNDPELREFTGKVDGTTMLFKDATEIKAGIPYIIKPKKDVVNPIFRNVTITEEIGRASCRERVCLYV